MTPVTGESFGFIRRAALSALRQKANLSIAALARSASIDPSYLSKIESGTKEPTPGVALRLANGLHVPLEAIYDLNPDRPFDLYVLGPANGVRRAG